MDWFSPEKRERLGKAGNRIATVLMYLSDVEEGGETQFPRAENGPISVKPRKGGKFFFFKNNYTCMRLMPTITWF